LAAAVEDPAVPATPDAPPVPPLINPAPAPPLPPVACALRLAAPTVAMRIADTDLAANLLFFFGFMVLFDLCLRKYFRLRMAVVLYFLDGICESSPTSASNAPQL
jgi:hypothetical protein